MSGLHNLTNPNASPAGDGSFTKLIERAGARPVFNLNSMERLKLYVLESYNELIHNVTWPSWASLNSTSVLVVVASLILALVIFVMDVASKGVLSDFLYELA